MLPLAFISPMVVQYRQLGRSSAFDFQAFPAGADRHRQSDAQRRRYHKSEKCGKGTSIGRDATKWRKWGFREDCPGAGLRQDR